MSGYSEVEPKEPLAQVASALYADQSMSQGDRDAMIDIIGLTYARFRERHDPDP